MAGTSNAFTAVLSSNQRHLSMATSSTSLSMKFMKDLGFEKPSWLPDFGGGDKKEGDDASTDNDAAPINADEKAAASESEPVAAKEEE